MSNHVEYRPLSWAPRYMIGSDGSVLGPKGNKLRPGLSTFGYEQALIYFEGGGRRMRAVHILVCETFHGEKPSPQHQVAHWDGNKLNNAASNLRWATAQENIHDKFRHGRIPSRAGELSGTVKLTDGQVREIRARYAAGEGQRSIARAYGVLQPAVSNIITGKTWGHLK